MKRKKLRYPQPKGNSSWLTALPLEEFKYILSKQEFSDDIVLRYKHPIKGLPKTCGSSKPNSIDHALCSQICGTTKNKTKKPVCFKNSVMTLRRNQSSYLFQGNISPLVHQHPTRRKVRHICQKGMEYHGKYHGKYM